MKSVRRWIQVSTLLVLACAIPTVQAQARKEEGSQGIVINAQPLPPEKPKAEEPKTQKRSKKNRQPEHFTAKVPKETPAKEPKAKKAKKA